MTLLSQKRENRNTEPTCDATIKWGGGGYNYWCLVLGTFQHQHVSV